ncbi:hypothetical protein [Streptosporangium canum]|uniref:hypothetical protein n=1 Tax=Streptosporangium canum TaxID=324952 RepID=UPI0037AFE84D
MDRGEAAVMPGPPHGRAPRNGEGERRIRELAVRHYGVPRAVRRYGVPRAVRHYGVPRAVRRYGVPR